jgi:hypothetical protein
MGPLLQYTDAFASGDYQQCMRIEEAHPEVKAVAYAIQQQIDFSAGEQAIEEWLARLRVKAVEQKEGADGWISQQPSP